MNHRWQADGPTARRHADGSHAGAAERRAPVGQRARAVTLGLNLAVGVGGAFAAQPPDAGSASQALQGQPPPLPAKPAPQADIEPPGAPLAARSAGVRIKVAGFRLHGASLYSENELQALVQDAVGRELGLADLQEEAARITAHYRAGGYPFARAYLPAQDIEDGTVTIAVLEGRYGAIGIDNRSAVPESVLSASLHGIEPGAVIAASSLERGLLLLSETPGVEVRSTLKPGAAVGTADLVVEAVPGKRLSGAIDADNYGNRFTGEHRLGATVNLASPAGRGDQLTLRALTAGDGLRYGRLGYQWPVGPGGLRAGIAWSDMGYRLGRDFASLDAHGTARIGTAWLFHPFLRSRAANLYGQLSYDRKRLDDRIDATATAARKTLRNWTLAVNGDRSDGWLGGGVTGASIAWTAGRLRIDSADAAMIDDATARSAGGFSKWAFSLTRLQRVADATQLYLSWNGQFAGKNLDSAEKLSLGGAFGVRAYPQGEASADEGHLINIELRHGFREAWQAVAFLDAGRVRINRKPWQAGVDRRHLKGIGLGLNWADAGWSVKSLLAWKLGDEEPTSDKNRTPRFWFQAVRYF